MAYTDFIAAIYLGTSRITGIVGKREAGTLSVIAYETESSANCIRRGNVHNVKETANKVRKIIQRLESKTPGNRIGKAYVGVGGQSVRSLEYTVSQTMETERMITEDIMDALLEKCRAYQPEGLDVLSVMPSACYLNGRVESDPVGVSCSEIEAKYQLIVARPSVRKRVMECITELVKIEVAGILPAPLVLANVALSQEEKNRGCALIDMGAGVTSLSVYKNGFLVCLHTIPLGGNLITKDIAAFLGIGEADAELLKRKYGTNALVNKEDDNSTFQVKTDRIELLSVKVADFNSVIEARLQEILENVYNKIEVVELKDLRSGIIITGKAANLENLTTIIYNRLKIEVRYASIRKDLDTKGSHPDLSPDGVALGLLLEGNINCAKHTQSEPAVVSTPSTPSISLEESIPEKKPASPPKPGKKGKIAEKLGGLMGNLFDE
jgi:cell division protein FtsA